MRFDLFNDNTWAASIPQVDIELAIDNKATGTIGQMICPLQHIKESLEKQSGLTEDEAYVIASRLATTYPEAFKIMNVDIVFPSSEIASIINDINYILAIWKANDVQGRRNVWRSLLPYLHRLKPYLDAERNGCLAPTLTQLRAPKVSGNAAWEAYLASEKWRRHVCNNSNVLQTMQIGRALDCTHDFTDD